VSIICSPVTTAYGHGIGADQSLPIYIANREIAVSASLKPDFIESPGKPQLIVRTFDSGNNSTIPGIDYRIAVQLHNKTLINQRFRSSDGIVILNLQPDKKINGWQIIGKESSSPDDPVQVSLSHPISIKSKIFTDGGLYHIIVTLEQSSTGLSTDSNHTFDLYVTVGRTFTFSDIRTPEGKLNMSARSYYDDIQKFAYNSTNKDITFSMPFAWNPDYVSQVPLVHIEIQFPKSIKGLQVNSYGGTVNGKDLDARALLIDDYSSPGSRIVHFVLTNNMLIRLAREIGDSNIATFSLFPREKPKFPMDIPSTDNKYVFELSWGPAVIQTNAPTTFAMNLQDTGGGVLSDSSFDFVLTQDDHEIYRQHLASNIGDYGMQYTFTKAGTVTLTASNINGEGQSASASINLIVQQGSNNNQTRLQTPQKSQPSGCLIATAAFGSELTPQVQFLRNFRDHYIMSTVSGAAFMNAFNTIYYSFSPQVADYERGQPWLQTLVRTGLYPLFGILITAQKTYSIVAGDAGSILAGATASSLIGAIYLWPAGYIICKKISYKVLILVIGAASIFLIISLASIQSLLPLSTSAFVITTAEISAIVVSKATKSIIAGRQDNKG
jgi:peptide/nickel transport system substrate-binding protein